MRLAVRLVVTIVAVVSIGIVKTATPASADVVFRVHTWNVQQGDDYWDNFHNDKVNQITNWLATYPAWQLSLEESCESIPWWIVHYLGTTYTYIHTQSSSGGTHCASNGAWGSYGNSTLLVGSYIAYQYHVLQPHAPAPHYEDKHIGCMTMQNFGFKYEGCTLHSSGYTVALSNQQDGDALNYALWWTAQYGAEVSVTAGDFNSKYTGPPLTAPTYAAQELVNWFWYFDEAWLPFNRVTQNTATMVDYTFGHRSHIQQWGRYVCQDSQYSDHHICPAVFRLTNF